MWELRVEGRLIEDPVSLYHFVNYHCVSLFKIIFLQPSGNNSGANTPAQPPRPVAKKKFSSFFKSLVIELDKDIYGPDNHLVEWHRTPQTSETDGFQVNYSIKSYYRSHVNFKICAFLKVKRPGDRPVKCTILLLLDYQPMRFKLHPRLAKVLGISNETRPKIIEALWQYIKTHKLQVIFLFF